MTFANGTRWRREKPLTCQILSLENVNFKYGLGRWFNNFVRWCPWIRTQSISCFHRIHGKGIWYSLWLTDFEKQLDTASDKKTKNTVQCSSCRENNPRSFFLITYGMETLSAFLTLYVGNPSVPGGFPQKGPANWSFDIFFVVGLNKWLSKQLISRWFGPPWRAYDVTVMIGQAVNYSCVFGITCTVTFSQITGPVLCLLLRVS